MEVTGLIETRLCPHTQRKKLFSLFNRVKKAAGVDS